MFGRLHLLLAAACVAVLFDEAFCQGYCSTATTGSLSGQAIALPTIRIDGYYSDWNVDVPTPAQCIVVNGVYARACDYDVKPEVAFQSQSQLKVHRYGQSQQSAPVLLTVYCLVNNNHYDF